MKKTVAFLLAFVMVLSMSSAFADGNLQVEQENFHVLPSKNYSSYSVYAKVANVGDEQICISSCSCEVYNENGDSMGSPKMTNVLAKWLQPGEYTYVWLEDSYDKDQVNPKDYKLTIDAMSSEDYVTHRFPCTTSYEPNEGSVWENYMYVTYTNDLAEPVFDIVVVFALLDAEGNILYMDEAKMYNEAVIPGNSNMIRRSIPTFSMEYFEKNGIVPASVDAIAYVYVKQ